MGTDVPVVANPEFLQEGRALQDFREPSRILIGSEDRDAAERLRELMSFTGARVVITDTSTAELAKYGSNAFLAMRISFANELARLAEREGADPIVMLEAVGLDPRIGSRYFRPGVGYGGSCLPKDVAALISMGSAANEPMELMRATQEVNDLQRRRTIRTLADGLGGLSGHRIAVLGLAFKPGTNDIRDSPGLQIARELTIAGAAVVAWDAAVTPDLLPAADAGMHVVDDVFEALAGADGAVLCTEWPEAVELDFRRAAAVMKGTLLVDGRYAWDPLQATVAGLDLVRIGNGRPVRVPSAREQTVPTVH
jgi:UDPglucose 6-dehydrogenase